MNRHLFRTLLLLLALLVPSVLAAATPQTPPDFSRAALLRIFGDFYSVDHSRLAWNAGPDLRVRFAPVVLPYFYDASRGDLMPDVSPFVLMNATYPATRDMVAVDDSDLAGAIREIEHAHTTPWE